MIIFKINYNKKLGKNRQGHIIVRHREKGIKSLYIPIDLNYFNCSITNNFKIKLFNDKNNYNYRNTKLILGLCVEGPKKGDFRYILKPNKQLYGNTLKFFKKGHRSPGDINLLLYFDINDNLYNIELNPMSHSKLCMSAECSSILLNKKNIYSIIKLPSNKIKTINNKCYASYDKAEKHNEQLKLNAGATRLYGYRPHVRGSAMNACDHPHGGGEGKTPIGKRFIRSFKGKKTKGVKTVKFKK